MGLDIQITEVGSGGRRVTLRGRLDTETAPILDERLGPLLASPTVTAALFDLAGLEYIGSAGLRVFVRTRRTLVRQVFDIVKALPSTDVFATDAELDAFLETMTRRPPAGGAV